MAAKNYSLAAIFRELCTLYGRKVISGLGMAQVFKNGQTNVHDEERSGRLSVITEELIKKIYGSIRESLIIVH